MLDAATATRRPPFRAVLVDDLSRLSRSIGDTWRIIDDLAAAGVKVIDVRTGMSSDDPNARVMFAASSMVNDQFLQLVRYQTHRGLQGRALGGFSTGGSLYGFATHPEVAPSNVEHPRKLWQINEAEAAIVRRIFTMVDEGKSYRAIADQLNREGVPPPRNNGRGGKHGGGWSHVTVRAILTNEKYVGRWTWNTTKWTRVPGKRTRRRLRRPESEHVTREAPELAIVDRAIWDRVQGRMARRTRGDERPPRQGQRTYLTSGLLRCGVWRPAERALGQGEGGRSLRELWLHRLFLPRWLDLRQRGHDLGEEDHRGVDRRAARRAVRPRGPGGVRTRVRPPRR
jgi:DNA invertase Pin-like site-specific DNA recombinase